MYIYLCAAFSTKLYEGKGCANDFRFNITRSLDTFKVGLMYVTERCSSTVD